MRIRKSDLARVQDGRKNGLMVAMGNVLEPVRTDLNNELSNYFKMKVPNFHCTFSDEDGEDIINGINEYLKDNEMKRQLEYPLGGGEDTYLIPIGERLNLDVIVVDEYYGDGEYNRYVEINNFLIDEHTTTKDVDLLVDFVNKYLK
ncbi:hypothetical protein AAGG74_16515 [Bacillus mexicanus]|uniref:hypothetical protein n=1 Tax=Bacillus mexicanus TaxID=2834415 RepID=UPI003D224AF5